MFGSLDVCGWSVLISSWFKLMLFVFINVFVCGNVIGYSLF